MGSRAMSGLANDPPLSPRSSAIDAGASTGRCPRGRDAAKSAHGTYFLTRSSPAGRPPLAGGQRVANSPGPGEQPPRGLARHPGPAGSGAAGRRGRGPACRPAGRCARGLRGQAGRHLVVDRRPVPPEPVALASAVGHEHAGGGQPAPHLPGSATGTGARGRPCPPAHGGPRGRRRGRTAHGQARAPDPQ